MILKAQILWSLGEIIDEDEFVNKKIGIVTPRRAQRSLIQNLLLNLTSTSITIVSLTL